MQTKNNKKKLNYEYLYQDLLNIDDDRLHDLAILKRDKKIADKNKLSSINFMNVKDEFTGKEIIKCEHLVKIYGNTLKKKIINDISFSIKDGDFIVIFGKSGSGKTTLLNILAGLLKQTSGTVEVLGKELNTMNHKEIYNFRTNEIGYVFQNYGLIPIVNVLDNICLGFVDRKYSKEQVFDFLKKLKMEHLAERFPHELSGGQKQRIAIARTLIKNPRIIFSDEPTGALDSEASKTIIKMFQKMNKNGRTIILVTHNEKLKEIANKIIRISDGKLIFSDKELKLENKEYISLSKKDFLDFVKTPKNPIVIETTNIVKSIKINKVLTPIISGINLKIYKNDFLVIFGESGSGKTSLLGLISALETPTSGDCVLLGTEINKFREKQLTSFRNKNVGYVFQSYGILDDINVLQNVLLNSSEKNKEYSLKLLKIVGLEDMIHVKAKKLSGGQQQRISICRALVKKPKLLFADEPTGAVDSETARSIIDLFQKINQYSDTTIIMVTHNKKLFEVGNRQIEIKDGLLISDIINKQIAINKIDWE